MIYGVKGFNEINEKGVGLFPMVTSKGEYGADCVECFLAPNVPKLVWAAVCIEDCKESVGDDAANDLSARLL